MPQTFQVLRCYKCLVFQVHQAKKSNKFECKLCGEKQSIKRHYGLGSGKECRLHVQKLNGIRGNEDDLNSLSSDNENCEVIQNMNQNNNQDLINAKNGSKWTEYLNEAEIDTNEPVNNDMYLGETEVVLEVPSKRRKFSRKKCRASYKFKDIEEVLQKESIEDPIVECKPNYISDSNIKFQSGTVSTSKQSVRKKFVPPTCSKISKWAHYIDEKESLNEEGNSNEDVLREHELPKDTFLENIQVTDQSTFDSQKPETIKNHSRYGTQTKTDQSNLNSNRKNIPRNQIHKLFSLCNDNDLDNILDI